MRSEYNGVHYTKGYSVLRQDTESMHQYGYTNEHRNYQ